MKVQKFSIFIVIFISLSWRFYICAAEFNYTKGARYINRNDVTTESAKEAFENIFQLLNQGTKLKKTIYDSKNRLIFIAGLEGTGHHAWQSMFKVCIRHRLCASERPLTDAMQQYDGTKIRGLFGAADSLENSEQFVFLYQRMKDIAAYKGTNPLLRIIGLGLVATARSGMLSYPNFNGLHKPLDNPDIHILATIAEAAKVDLRIILMNRDANAIIKSINRRGWGSDYESKVLSISADALHNQLDMLDSNFYYCVNFDSLGDRSVMLDTNLINFIYPPLSKIWNEMVSKINLSNSITKQNLNIRRFSIEQMNQGNRTKDEYFNDLNREYQSMYLNLRIDQIQQHCQ